MLHQDLKHKWREWMKQWYILDWNFSPNVIYWNFWYFRMSDSSLATLAFWGLPFSSVIFYFKNCQKTQNEIQMHQKIGISKNIIWTKSFSFCWLSLDLSYFTSFSMSSSQKSLFPLRSKYDSKPFVLLL